MRCRFSAFGAIMGKRQIGGPANLFMADDAIVKLLVETP
jgi:hypothetical protein